MASTAKQSVLNSALRGVIQLSDAFQGGTWDLWEVVRYDSLPELESGQVILRVNGLAVKINVVVCDFEAFG